MVIRDHRNLVHECIELLDHAYNFLFEEPLEVIRLVRNTGRTVTARSRCGVRVKVYARKVERLAAAPITCLICWQEMFRGER